MTGGGRIKLKETSMSVKETIDTEDILCLLCLLDFQIKDQRVALVFQIKSFQIKLLFYSKCPYLEYKLHC